MTPTHDVSLVVLSVILAVLASYTALELAGLITVAQHTRKLWLALLTSGQAMVDSHGRLGAVMVMHDKRKQSESALSALKWQNELILNSVGEGIYGVDLQGNTTFVNPAATRMTGWKAEELIGKSQHAMLHHSKPDGTHYPVHECSIYAAFKDGVVHHADDEVFWRKDGTSFPVDYISTPIRERGKLVGAVVVFRDITERKRAEEALRQQNERDRMLGAIASRIRGSLNLNEILKTTVAEVRQFLEADRVMIYRLVPNQHGGIVAESVALEWTLDLAKDSDITWFSKIRAEYQHKCIHTVNDIAQAGFPPEYAEFMSKLQVKAELVVPIFQDDQLWGLLTVHQCSRPRQWQHFETQALEQLAIQVAIAIQQAQLFSQVQQQSQREQLLNQISRALNTHLDPDYILQEIVKLTGECFGVDRVLIYGLATEQIEVLKEWRVRDQVVSILGFKLPISELGPNSELASQQVHAPNCAEILYPPGLLTIIHHGQSLSILSVPIFIRDQFFGGLSLHTTTAHRTFTQDEIHLLERIADQAALALYNAQSYEQLDQLIKERTQELEEEKLLSEAANRAKSEFLSNMSHELRTPLTGILGFSSVLLEQIFGPLNAKQQKYIELISDSGKHLLALINDLLDLSKIEAGREELTLETILVEELASACIAMIRERANSRGLQLSLLIATDLTTCIADKRRLTQILFNLLSNAVKFTDAGSVTLKVNKTEGTINFSVIDTGIGIAEADLATLFQPFRQLDSGLDRKYEGTGLGLALTRKLAQLHGGYITINSELGRGSCFTLYLPEHPPDFSGR